MSIKEKLDSKFGIQDPIHIAEYGGWPDSAFGYRGFSKVSNFVWDTEDVEVMGREPAYGREVRFTLPKGAHMHGPLFLETTVSALTNSGGSSRFVDYAGMRIINSITVKYGSNQIQKFEWPVLHFHHRMFKSREMQEAHDVAVAGNLSTGQRDTLGASAQTWMCPLPLYWTEHIQKFLNNEALSHELDIYISVTPLLDMTQSTAGTAEGTITSMKLRTMAVYFQDEERDNHVDRTLIDAGEVMAINDYETQLENRLTSGQTTYYVNLTNLKGPAYAFTFVIRDADSIDDAGETTNEPYLYEYYPGLVHSVEASGGLQIYRPMSGRETVYINNAMHWAGPIGEPIYCRFPCINIQDRINSYGHDNFSGFTNPRLKLVFESALAEDKIVDVILFTRNTVQLSKADLVKNFH